MASDRKLPIFEAARVFDASPASRENLICKWIELEFDPHAIVRLIRRLLDIEVL